MYSTEMLDSLRLVNALSTGVTIPKNLPPPPVVLELASNYRRVL